jgi:DNA polymerase-3 subunit gamma/tau
MQVLVETKSRMQRVTYGRALLELAVVRICLLEQLEDVAGLIRNLRELPAGSAVTSDRPGTRPAPPTRPVSAPPSADARKKNELSEAREPESAESVGPAEVVATGISASRVESVAVVPFSEETLQGIWEKVVASQSEASAGHLRNASRVAISGPNGLEIVFPARYSFGRTYCQRPETITRLKACLREVVGQDIHITISAEGPSEVPAATVAAPTANRRSSLESMQKNEFVQQVTSIFGGTLVDVRPVAATNHQEA